MKGIAAHVKDWGECGTTQTHQIASSVDRIKLNQQAREGLDSHVWMSCSPGTSEAREILRQSSQACLCLWHDAQSLLMLADLWHGFWILSWSITPVVRTLVPFASSENVFHKFTLTMLFCSCAFCMADWVSHFCESLFAHAKLQQLCTARMNSLFCATFLQKHCTELCKPIDHQQSLWGPKRDELVFCDGWFHSPWMCMAQGHLESQSLWKRSGCTSCEWFSLGKEWNH